MYYVSVLHTISLAMVLILYRCLYAVVMNPVDSSSVNILDHLRITISNQSMYVTFGLWQLKLISTLEYWTIL